MAITIIINLAISTSNMMYVSFLPFPFIFVSKILKTCMSIFSYKSVLVVLIIFYNLISPYFFYL